MRLLQRTRLYYGWFIVLASFLIMAAGWGIIYNCAGLFVEPITGEFGFSRSEYNLTMTLRAICQVLISLAAGIIFRKSRILPIIKAGTILLIVSYLMNSFADSLPAFYLIALLNSIAISLISVLPLSIILSNWFQSRRGVAIGLAFMGSGVGGMIFNALAGIWIEAFGWREAYRILTVIMAVILIPSVFLILKVRPEDIGVVQTGNQEVNTESREKETAESGMTLNQVLRTPAFWGLNFAAILMNVAINSLMMNVAPHLQNIGYSISTSAYIVALTMGSLAVGKVILGKLYDKTGVKGSTYIATIANILALTGLIYASNIFGVGLTILFIGIGCAFATIAPPIISIELYGRKDYGSIFGVMTAVGSLGNVVGPLLTGVLYDSSGSYFSSILVSILFSTIALLLYLVLFSSKRAKEA